MLEIFGVRGTLGPLAAPVSVDARLHSIECWVDIFEDREDRMIYEIS